MTVIMAFRSQSKSFGDHLGLTDERAARRGGEDVVAGGFVRAWGEPGLGEVLLLSLTNGLSQPGHSRKGGQKGRVVGPASGRVPGAPPLER